jgi:hypothetical protein
MGEAVQIQIAVFCRGIAVVVTAVVGDFVLLGAHGRIVVVAIPVSRGNPVAIGVQSVARLVGAAAVLVDAIIAAIDPRGMHVRSRVVAIFGFNRSTCACGTRGARVLNTAVVAIAIDVREVTAGTILIDTVVGNLVGPRKCAGVAVIAIERSCPPIAVHVTEFLTFVITAGRSG